ncbi:unnamed protein product [Miscanthus lutarioriparius]|uniref:Uncharacterized protein n=1 Tax=Miscanthus lutarioriparius TaxID=422564 RepID=A0A811SBX6_9POAL|nr:unnamed protein product [Miscanthus lutarioriparius]
MAQVATEVTRCDCAPPPLDHGRQVARLPHCRLRLARMNSLEWAYALVGSFSSMVCGSFSAIFTYILNAVLSVYYAPDPRYMKDWTVN